ncbi:bifunctional DNA primase/polymerase [Saccharopolyspora indica]|uniref:bifunctional DNA primase/polymerase n=1 Tax=Saccharopolyspora indica TaxID=1229659 RepID=UPI0022EB3AE0|nr:bifunctional DNA primase/polymerase [Saccharopolyspora indica]MDA3644169.1 bifunctional DNA primase/polymerase [Saccharopolyspora indica]
MNATSEQLRQWALCLAELGWKVFPLLPGSKRPALHGHRTCTGEGICRDGHQGWEQRATSDPDRISRCWSDHPYNIGLATGPSQLLVIDLDQPKPGQVGQTGAERLADLARRTGEEIPETYTVTTPSGGTHLYFRAPAEPELRNTSGTLGPLIDTRGHGGYVVAAGSITPQGGYELYDDSEPVELPGWLARALAVRPSTAISAPREIAAARPSAYVAAALRAEADRVATAAPGQQNNTLYTAALALGRLVAGGAVEEARVRAVLHRAMSRLPDVRPHDPWTPSAIDATVSSGLRAAAASPRRIGRRSGSGSGQMAA